MRLDQGETITQKPVCSPSLDQLVGTHSLEHLYHETTTAHRPPDGHFSQADYFSIVARATNDAVRDWNLKTDALSWPQGLESLLRYETCVAEQTLQFWQKNIHPSDRSRVEASLRVCLASSDDHWSGEYRFRGGDGSYINILERAVIFRAKDGAAERLVGSLMDVTARKQLQDQLCRSQKMEAFGQLAGGLAHDFNNFLTTILGYGDLLLHERQIKGVLADHVAEVRAAAGRASTLTQQLLAFSRKQALENIVV